MALPRQVILDELVRLGTFSADDAVLSRPEPMTDATKAEIAVRAALDALETNGMIAFTMDEKPYEYRVNAYGGSQGKAG